MQAYASRKKKINISETIRSEARGHPYLVQENRDVWPISLQSLDKTFRFVLFPQADAFAMFHVAWACQLACLFSFIVLSAMGFVGLLLFFIVLSAMGFVGLLLFLLGCGLFLTTL